MPSTKRASQFAVVSLLTTLLTASFLFMAPLGARYLHMSYGRWQYWLFAAVSTTGLIFVFPQWALAQGIVFLLMGLYAELELQKVSRFNAAFSAVATTLVAAFFAMTVWAQSKNVGLITFLKNQVSETMLASPQIKDLPVPIEAMQIVTMLPALVAFLMMILVCFGVLFIRPLGKKEKITSFQVPDNMIWVLIASLAGSFLVDPIKMFVLQKVCFNLLFVCSAAYYFQGLAVLGFLMDRVRMNYFFKVALFFVLGFQLFAAVVALGVAEVWFNFRSKVFKNLIKSNPYVGD